VVIGALAVEDGRILYGARGNGGSMTPRSIVIDVSIDQAVTPVR
jgi:hypothetical protein